MTNTPTYFLCNSVELDIVRGAALPTEIEIIPTGELRLSDRSGQQGPVVAKISDPAGVVSRSMAAAKGGMLPIDFDHGIDELGTRSGKAAGWMTAMRVDGDRILASVEWTPSGKAALKGREYRFVSPVFYTDKRTKEVTLIARAGLTNSPALPELKILASSQEKDTMPQWLKDLAAKLGMPDETDEAKITAAANARIDQVALMQPVLAAAGLDGDLTEAGATAIVTKMTASAGDGAAPDPSQFVPMQMFQEVQSSLAALQKTVAGGESERLVASAMEAGKVTPGQKDWATTYANNDPDGFKAYLASAPVRIKGGELLVGQPPAAEGELTPDEKRVCAATGISEEAFLATKQGKKPASQTKEA